MPKHPDWFPRLTSTPARLRPALLEALSAIQSGRCAICQQPERLVPDLRRDSRGVPRGALCLRCRRAVGIARDDPDQIERTTLPRSLHARARAYLRAASQD